MTIPQLIAQVRALDRRTASVADYRRLFDLITNGHIFPTITPREGLWYRVRSNHNQTFFEKIKEVWYPPADRVKIGRANEPGNPVLYLSNDGAVALRETRFTSGDWLTVLTCRINPTTSLKLQAVGLREHVRKGNLPDVFDEIDQLIGNAHRQGYGNPADQLFVSRYLMEEFTRDVSPDNEHEYKPSAAIAALLMSYSACDGIAYPAIKSAKLDVNIALKPDSADIKLEVVAVDVVEAKRFADGEIAVSRVATSSAFTSDGSITYRDAKGQTAALPWINPDRRLSV